MRENGGYSFPRYSSGTIGWLRGVNYLSPFDIFRFNPFELSSYTLFIQPHNFGNLPCSHTSVFAGGKACLLYLFVFRFVVKS